MLYLITKALLSGFIIMAVSEIAKRCPAFGALVASLPLVSILAIIWLWPDTANTARVEPETPASDLRDERNDGAPEISGPVSPGRSAFFAASISPSERR